MRELIYKEFKLAKHPTMFIFPIFAAMLLIPSYPYALAFMYTILAVFYMFLSARENNDVLFTVLLPIRKRDAVKARFAIVLIMEIVQVIVCIPFAIISSKINPNIAGNSAGIEANAALFGFALIMFAVFNLIFLPMFYKTGYKIGIPFVIAALAVTVFIGIVETMINIIPYFKQTLDTVGLFHINHIIILVLGIVIYAVLTFFAYKLSVKRFERTDVK